MFNSVNDELLATQIRLATHRVALVAPAVSKLTADALGDVLERDTNVSVTVIVDCSEDAYRVGYADADGLARMKEVADHHGVELREERGLRIGLLFVDGDHLIWSPTPQSVEAERGNEQPNGLLLTAQPSDIDMFSDTLMGDKVAGAVAHNDSDTPVQDAEIGRKPLQAETIESTVTALKTSPPAPFDLNRRAWMYSTKIQFVETRAEGVKLSDRVLRLDGLDLNRDVSDRLKRYLDTRIKPFTGFADEPIEVQATIAGRLAFDVDGEPQQERQVLDEGLGLLGGETLSAVADVVTSYGPLNASSDTNTVGAAALGHQLTHAASFHAALRSVDAALAKYAAAAPAMRPEAERRVRLAYRLLNDRFARDVQARLVHKRSPAALRRNPFVNPERGMNMARSGSKHLPLTGREGLRPVRTFMRHGRVIGRGMMVLDLGIRTNNVRMARANGLDPYRVLTQEALGFGLTLGLGAVALWVLGPVGWLLAIFVVGSAAVLADLTGKYVGGRLYDQF